MSVRLPDKDPAEKILVEIDFGAEMAAGESIGGAVLSMAVLNGADANPGAMLDGAATIVERKVYQRIAGGVNGNVYKLRCVANISSGNVLVRAGDLPVRDA